MAEHTECMALLLSGPSFESFYGDVMHLNCEQYLSSYRNDFSFMYAYALAKVGFKTVIYMPAWDCRGLHRIDEGVYVRFLPLASWFRPWRRHKNLSRTPIGRYIASFANLKAFLRPLKEGLLEDHVNVLYVQEYWTARFDCLTRTLQVPVVGADHGGKRKGQIVLFKQRSFQQAAAITCQTEDECSQVAKLGGKPVLVQNGVDTAFYSPRPEVERTMSILIVARLTDRQKRISDLIRVMQQLPRPWQLQIVGSGPDEEVLHRLSEELGVAERISFLGFVTDRSEIRELYRQCGIYCMPSANEGMPLAALEAMSCGCAVVVTSIRAFEELVEQDVSGLKVAVGDQQQLAAAIGKAWENRERLGAGARERIVKDYSLSAMATRLATVMRENYNTDREDTVGTVVGVGTQSRNRSTNSAR